MDLLEAMQGLGTSVPDGRRHNAGLVPKRGRGRVIGANGYEPAKIFIHALRQSGCTESACWVLCKTGSWNRQIPL